MRHLPCSPNGLGIITFGQGHLVELLLVQNIPLVLLVRLDHEHLSDLIRMDQLHMQKIAVWDSIGVNHPQRILIDGLERPPDVDDFAGTFE